MRSIQHTIGTVLVALGLAVAAPSLRAFTVDPSATTPTNVTGLWWNASESGWGVNFIQQSNVIFMTMFTYDASGTPVWYVASNCPVAADGCRGELYRVRGGQMPTRQWIAGSVNVTKVGDFNVAFTDNNTGFITFSIDGIGGAKAITRQIFAAAVPPPPPAPPVNDRLTKTEMLIGGTFYLTFTIISTYTDSFTFTGPASGPNSSGDYTVLGKDQFGGAVGGSYGGALGLWGVLSPGPIIDEFYTFNFSDLNHVAGCYYQINPPGSTNLSRCYSMVGIRSPQKAYTLRSPAERSVREEGRLGEATGDNSMGTIEPGAVEAYLAARKLLQ